MTDPAPVVSSAIPEAQQAALQKVASDRQARADELNKLIAEQLGIFNDPAKSMNERYFAGVKTLEAEQRLLAMAVQGLSAQAGIGGGLKDILKMAAPQIESAQMAYREIAASQADAVARIDRLERNLKAWIEKGGGTYQL